MRFCTVAGSSNGMWLGTTQVVSMPPDFGATSHVKGNTAAKEALPNSLVKPLLLAFKDLALNPE